MIFNTLAIDADTEWLMVDSTIIRAHQHAAGALGGNASDYTQEIQLIEGQDAKHIVTDKGYDSQAIIDAIEAKGAEPVIPPRSLRKTKREHDRYTYKERNVIERMFNKLKQFRRVPSRYDKLATSFFSFLHLAAIAA